METPALKAARLLGALDEMVEQEGMYLRGGYYDLAGEIRQRAEPLVQMLVGLAGQPGVSALGSQVTALVERSDRHAAFMRDKLQELDQEIQRIDQARFRTAQVAPAYTQAAEAIAPRFEAAC